VLAIGLEQAPGAGEARREARLSDGLAMDPPSPAQDDQDRIEDRQAEHQDRRENRHRRRALLEPANRNDPEREAEELTSGVAEKDARRAEVGGKEAKEAAGEGETDHRN